MFPSPRPFLLIFLAMLQFIAPLVHAHAGQNHPDAGLHVPGLESYGLAADRVAMLAHNHVASSGDFIFSVDTGIQQSRTLNLAETPDYVLPLPPRVFRAIIPSIVADSPPQLSRFVSSLPSPPQSPRAPPV